MQAGLIMITGASSGIGAAVACRFSQAGHPLALLARRLAPMEALALPQSACVAVDVVDGVAVAAALAETESQWGPCVGLVNCAGFIKTGAFHDVALEDHAAMVQVNLMGVINSMNAVLPGMRARGDGTIINISSTADRHPRPHIATYAASKAAVKSLTESLRADNASYGVRIALLAPAKVATPMLLSSDLPQDQLIQVDEVAEAVYWMFQQPKHFCVRDLVVAPTGFVP